MNETILEGYEIHPVTAMFPILPDEELQDLADDIRTNGQQQSIVHDTNGVIAQGWNRLWSHQPGLVITAPSDWPGRRIQRLRRQHGLSQQQLSEVLGVNRTSIAQWETARADGPQKASVCRLLDLLETHPDIFLGE